MNPSRPPNPIEKLYSSLNKEVLIKTKRNREFRGTLRSYDNHLNLKLEKCVYKYQERQADETYLPIEESFDEIIIRGDNIIFIGFE